MRSRVAQALILALAYAIFGLAVPPRVSLATGETDCQATNGNPQAGEVAGSGNYVIGARATIEGQALPLCTFTLNYASGSFHWAAIENVNPSWLITGANIVQIGYGRCTNANNNLGLGTLCTGGYYYYWAWGTEGCGSLDGSGPGLGPVAIRIGASLSNPPASADFYVLRHSVSGTIYYDGYRNGSLLTGTNALGQQVSARVAASRLCWDSNQTYRRLAWFGETYNWGDSMGGWSGGSRDHLDYNPLQYSWGTGWNLTNLSAPQSCNATPDAPTFSCTIASAAHIYIDTANR